MKAILLLLTVHTVPCANLPSLAWKFSQATVMDYAKNTYGATPKQLAYLKWCISRPQPGG